jgi:DNA replication protein DnaC
MSKSLNWGWDYVGNETEDEIAVLDEMLAAAQRFLDEIRAGAEPRWLTYLGKSGTGKTHLAQKIGTWMRKFGERIYNETVRAKIDPDHARASTIYFYRQEGPTFVKWGETIEQLRDRQRWPFHRACIDHYKVVDDLGANSFDRENKATVFAVQNMAEMLDRRLGKWSVFTSNFMRKELAEQFDVRIASRLMRSGNVIVNCDKVRDYARRKEEMK